MNAKEIIDHARILETYFEDDERFEFVSTLGVGSYGSASRVRYNDPVTNTQKNIVVKQAFSDETIHGATHSLRVEREIYQRLRHSMHIARMLDIPGNPLESKSQNTGNAQATGSNGRPDFPNEWLILEYLEHGNLEGFIYKAANSGIERLPNRLLWRFFLCLTRACIGMAKQDANSGQGIWSSDWPAKDPNNDTQVLETPEEGVEESVLVHADLHDGNVMIGEPPLDAEHTIAPILKAIDFGQAVDILPCDELPTAAQDNIRDIGELMMKVILLGEFYQPQRTTFALVRGGRRIATHAAQLLPLYGPARPFPALDPWLGQLVCLCVACEPGERPGLAALLSDVEAAVRTRGPAYYNGAPEEADDAVAALWRAVVLDAPTDEVMDDDDDDLQVTVDDGGFSFISSVGSGASASG
ncbi:hypothetical protein F4780DRAFT_797708 [Xylariomycetidae sp. FL0641]|nr:hypothetical protein F4780DRAFT_797708 [Xylariomycetidae sp. FL0641]